LFSPEHDKREMTELAKMMLNGTLPIKPFKSYAIDMKEYNEAYSSDDKLLSNAEIKEFVEIISMA
jgi:hypothetical protein